MTLQDDINTVQREEAIASYGQQQRQRTRTTTGQYNRGPQCELCGKPAGWDYCSAPNGQPLVVCARRACQTKLQTISETQYSAQA